MKDFPIAQCTTCKGFYPEKFVVHVLKPINVELQTVSVPMCHECREAKRANLDKWAKKHGLPTADAIKRWNDEQTAKETTAEQET